MTTAVERQTLESLRDEQRGLRSQLARLRRRFHLELALELAAETAGILAATGVALVLFDWWLRPGRSTRLTLLLASLTGVMLLLAGRIWRRWRAARVDDLSLAVILDRFRPGTGQRVADVLQLPHLLDAGGASVSPAMVRLAVQRASAALAESDWRLLWNRTRTAAFSGLFLLGVAVPIAFAMLAPEAARLSVARWLRGSSERWPQHTYLTVMGLDGRGRVLAPRDEPLTLEVRSDLPLLAALGQRWVIRGRDEPLVLRRRPTAPVAPASVQLRERNAKGTRRGGTMTAVAPGRFRYEMPADATSSTFELTGGDDWLGPIAIERVDRPALAGIQLRVREPGAASAGFRTIADPRQHLQFLPDTEVQVTLRGSEPLAGTQLKINPGKAPDLKRVDTQTFTTAWTLREATTLEIVLTSGKTGLDSRPAFLSIGILRDREPRVTVRALGIGSHVTPVATLPLSVAATDDLGLAAMRLRIDRTLIAPQEDVGGAQEGASSESKMQNAKVDLPLAAGEGRAALDQQVRHDLDLNADPPPVGTLIRIVGEADDRCARGPQTGRSSVLALSVVSVEELFYEVLIRQRAERAKFMAIVEAHEKQTPVLEAPNPPSAEDWVRLARLEQSSARQLDQVAGRLTDTLQEMKLNQVGSPKSHRLLQEEVIDPIRALAAGPASALRNLVQGLANSGQSSPATRESARRLHDEVVIKMRTILAQMSQWESFVDVVNQVAEVIRMEQKVLQETEKARETRTREVFDGKP